MLVCVRALVLALSLVLAGSTGSLAQDRQRQTRAAELSALAHRFAEAGDRVSARAYYRDAISADPSYADAYVALGELELSRDAYRDAEATFRVGLVRAGSDARLWIGLARALTGLGAPDDADSVLAQADAQLPEDVGLLAFRAEHAEQRGRWSLALSITRRLVAIAARDGDRDREAALRARARALEVLVGELDPVRAPPSAASRVRRLLASPPS
jgi:tetratricopeptide (TPR) repeat protein